MLGLSLDGKQGLWVGPVTALEYREVRDLVLRYEFYLESFHTARKTLSLTHPVVREWSGLVALVVNDLRDDHGLEIDDLI